MEFAENHVKADALPAIMALGLALIDTVGVAADTVTVAAWVALPPGPEHIST